MPCTEKAVNELLLVGKRRREQALQSSLRACLLAVGLHATCIVFENSTRMHALKGAKAIELAGGRQAHLGRRAVLSQQRLL